MKNILLAYDGSKYAEEAAKLFAHLPHRERIRLTVVTVLEVPRVTRAYATANWVAGSADREHQLAREKFATVERMFDGANVELEHRICEGHPAYKIVEEAERCEADLVVVGTKGHTTISRLLLGSTSDYVATRAPCSVFVVRPTGLMDNPRPLRIALGYNGSHASKGALRDVRDICRGKDTEVFVLSVASYVLGFYDEMAPDPQLIRAEAAESLQEALGELQGINDSTQGQLLEKPHVGDGLVNAADELGVDVLVVGETQHSQLTRLLLGSVSRYVIRHAECSVWVSRHPEED